MLPAQRQGLILAEIERSGGARIVQLAELLGVSDMMVRGDIDVLAARGLVAKVYGGATVPPQGTSDEPGFEAKSWREQAAKERIAAAARGPGTAQSDHSGQRRDNDVRCRGPPGHTSLNLQS
jgi:DeoR/GlpR family transcriptional regulator of sugar metabolism